MNIVFMYYNCYVYTMNCHYLKILFFHDMTKIISTQSARIHVKNVFQYRIIIFSCSKSGINNNNKLKSKINIYYY